MRTPKYNRYNSGVQLWYQQIFALLLNSLNKFTLYPAKTQVHILYKISLAYITSKASRPSPHVFYTRINAFIWFFRAFVPYFKNKTHMRVTFWHKKIEIFSISKCIYFPLSRINTAFLVVSFYDFNTYIKNSYP